MMTLGRGSFVPESIKSSSNWRVPTALTRSSTSLDTVRESDHFMSISRFEAAEPKTPTNRTFTLGEESSEDKDFLHVPSTSYFRALRHLLNLSGLKSLNEESLRLSCVFGPK